jgi:hypothetical protein
MQIFLPARAAQDDEHLSALDQAIKVSQDLNLGLSSASQPVEEAGNLQRIIPKRLLVVSRLAVAVDGKVPSRGGQHTPHIGRAAAKMAEIYL